MGFLSNESSQLLQLIYANVRILSVGVRRLQMAIEDLGKVKQRLVRLTMTLALPTLSRANSTPLDAPASR